MKILLALDGSANGDLALEKVLGREWPQGSQCQVLTVNEPLSAKSPAAKILQLESVATLAHQSLEADLRELLADTVQRLSEKFGADKTSSALLEGNVKDRILETAKTWGADLVVLGAPGGDGVNEAGSGGLTRGIVGQAPCSVLVVRPIPAASVGKKVDKGLDPTIESRFLVAVNDSANSQSLVKMILDMPWPNQSHFQVLTVSEPVRVPSHAKFFKSKEVQDFKEKTEQALRKQADEYAEKVARTLETKLGNEKVTFHGLEGNARSLIIQIATDWPADTVIMGAEDEVRTAGEFFFGSTADAVLTFAPCSVQFVRGLGRG